MRRVRELIGDIVWWVLLALALPIHVATVIVAFEWHRGWRGLVAAVISFVVPVVPEVFWAARVALAEGTVLHWYVLLVITYPALWTLWLIGGTLYGSDPGQE